MAGKFELYNDAKGKFRFRQKASNGEIIAVGEAYEVEGQREEGHRVGAEERGPAPRVDLTE
ncbi:MAG: DUF1508 domain-containing protein [Mycobacterium sp.]